MPGENSGPGISTVTPAKTIATPVAAPVAAPASDGKPVFATSLNALSAIDQHSIGLNAAANGVTPDQYLVSRGGVNPVTHKFGDSFNPNLDLTDAEYAAALAKGGGGAINAALEAKANAYYQNNGGVQGSDGSWYPNAVAARQAAISSGGGGFNAATATGVSTVKPGGSANADPGALQIVTDALKAAGLGNLASKAWTMWNSGLDFNAIMDDPTNGIRASAEYKQNFPAMAALNAKGQGISEKQYLDKETADLELMKQYGIPTGVFDSKEYLGSLMTNNVTQVDLEKRLMAVQQTANSFDSNITNYAKDTYGLSTGDLMAYMLDPNKALPVIQQKAQAMQIGGAAYQQGFAGGLGTNGELSQTQAEALAAQGVSQASAQSGFLNIGQEGQLAQALPGDTSGSVTNQQLINAQFGVNAEDLTAVKKVQSKRVAEYQQGGGFAAGAAGASGLGVANAGS